MGGEGDADVLTFWSRQDVQTREHINT